MRVPSKYNAYMSGYWTSLICSDISNNWTCGCCLGSKSTGERSLTLVHIDHKQKLISHVFEEKMDATCKIITVSELSKNLIQRASLNWSTLITITHLWITVILSKWYIYKNLHRTPWIFTIGQDETAPVPASSKDSQSTVTFICSRAGQWLCRCPRRCSWSSKGQRRWPWTGGRDLHWRSWSLCHRERSPLTPARCPYKTYMCRHRKGEQSPERQTDFVLLEWRPQYASYELRHTMCCSRKYPQCYLKSSLQVGGPSESMWKKMMYIYSNI